MAKAMIVSLGGTPQPVIVAINYYKPEFVCFFASEQSVELVYEVKQKVDAASFRNGKEIVKDPNDLLACYSTALKAADRVAGEGFAPADVVVDYTGGTKSMTGALVLATVARGYTFSYVGGAERTKGGLGQVIDGTERVFEGLNPWEVFAVAEKSRLAWLFNHYQFAAALELIQSILSKARHEAQLGRLFRCLSDVVVGYADWDRFAHREAARALRQGLQGVQDCALFMQDADLRAFVAEMEQSLAFFNRIASASAGFQRLCQEMVVDLIANADRRAEEGKYDDAIARLYRALEMAAQVALAGRNIQAGNADPNQVPESLRSEFVRRYFSEEDSALKLPLYASYRLLAELGDPLGGRFLSMGERVRGLLSARNDSILAHGMTPLGRKTWESLRAGLLEILEMDEAELPRFPKLRLGQ